MEDYDNDVNENQLDYMHLTPSSSKLKTSNLS